MTKGKHDTVESSDSPQEENKEKKANIDNNISPLSLDLPSRTATNFTAADFERLMENEHGRYPSNSKKIAHAVISKDNDDLIAVQYELPAATNTADAPVVRPLINIEEIEPFPGMQRYRAETPDGHTRMYAKRFIDGNVGENNESESFRIACFSPTEANKSPFWGSIRSTPLFRDDLSKAVKKNLEKELKAIKPVIKGGELVIDPPSVLQRDLIKTRTPNQNEVMGESARDAYEHFFERMVDELHPEMKQRLTRAFTADSRSHLNKNSYRPEWLHAQGWSLTPMDKNPQTTDNLGAGPKWANTQMMILERIVRWFAVNAPEALLSIKPKFDMLLDSELIQHIDFKVKVQIKERFVELAQSIDPFQPYPLFAKSSDLAQGAGIVHGILHHNEPKSKQIIKKQDKKTPEKAASDSTSLSSIITRHRAYAIVPKSPMLHIPVTKDTQNPEDRAAHVDGSAGNELRSNSTFSVLSEKEPKSKPESRKRKREKDDLEEMQFIDKNKRVKYAPENQYERSVVQIYADSFMPDYDNPWRDPETVSGTGSGFVVADDAGNKFIVTNAHVAENPIFLQVRLANDRHRKYEAKVKCISYQCDLALLTVEDEEFHELAQPVKLGGMVNLRQKIMVVGFPMGGTEISLSRGIVSRIQVDTYSMSNQGLLQVQVDAAINPGNSGGPTFVGDKVVGVAFQGYDRQGLGYIIPMPIVQHFLIEALSTKPYRGFPTLAITTEALENPHERSFYQLDNKTGIRIIKVDYLSDAFSKLKRDDILLSIDGLPVSNEGTVDIPGIGSCIDFFHVTQSKFIGDSVVLKVLRRDLISNQVEELDIEVVLDTILGDTEKIPVMEHDKMPTFYINSGISFMPLTRNYMEGEGDVFSEMLLVEEGCTLSEAPKKNPDEQIVVINAILKCSVTQGYHKHLNSIVKEINGKPINTIYDAVLAMAGHQGEKHIISLASKSKIIIPNMSVHEHAQLLKKNHISHDCSSDLQALVSAARTNSLLAVEGSSSRPATPFALGLFNVEKTELQQEYRMDLLSETAEVGSSHSEQDDMSPKELTKDLLPGLNHYKLAIEALEERSKNLPEDDEEEDEDYETSSKEDSEESESVAESVDLDKESMSDDDTVVVNPLIQSLHMKRRYLGLFSPSASDVDSSAESRAHCYK